MRVAYVCADAGVAVFGHKGSSIHVQEVIAALTRRGADVEVFATRLGGDPPPELAVLRVHRLPPPADGERAVREAAALAANDDLCLTLQRAGRFDTVYER